MSQCRHVSRNLINSTLKCPQVYRQHLTISRPFLQAFEILPRHFSMFLGPISMTTHCNISTTVLCESLSIYKTNLIWPLNSDIADDKSVRTPRTPFFPSLSLTSFLTFNDFLGRFFDHTNSTIILVKHPPKTHKTER